MSTDHGFWEHDAVCEHEASIGGDGYGNRCCGVADVMVLREAYADCKRQLCESCHDDRCCRRCDAKDVEWAGLFCTECEAQLDYTEARANEELDQRDVKLRKSWGEK